ncbi:uncharacterized protein LOC123871597 [Maniola jurtina]|uniref:uncharacterized protein LOC123871597 n=1 Tax=Maniola jurtina TaxID=191418 RepID=UPI001E686B9C|nr:uncharacterized protein LOC123871597 [Maniola jurtina]
MVKFFKKLLIEITLFIAMVALAGHVTVNFWEQYVVQDNLLEMKESLDHLKVTVNNMGYAYDDLQRDLIELAKINSKSSKSSIPRVLTQEPISCKKRGGLDHKVLEHWNLLFAQNNDKAPRVLITDKNVGSAPVPSMALVKNATTATRLPLKATAVGSETVTEFQNLHENECIYKCRARNSVRRCYEDCESTNKIQKF